MREKYRTVLYINLSDRKVDFKTHGDLNKYIGGIGIAYKLMLDNIVDAKVVIATGPLAGLFPFVSKTVVLYKRKDNQKVHELFGGGSIAGLMNLAGIDAIVITGETHEELDISILNGEVLFSSVSNKSDSVYIKPNISLSQTKVVSDGYFSFGEVLGKLDLSFSVDINIKETEDYDIYDYYGYTTAYDEILDLYKTVGVEPRNNPSCFGCPLGCDFSSKGEDKLTVSVLARCLVACGYANQIYKEVPLVYACLSSIGYNYYHSDLTNISDLVGELKASVNKI